MILGDEPRSTYLEYEWYKRHFMTLIVGLACKDGVVLAADGISAGLAHERGLPFRISLPVSKINLLGDNILWGGAGNSATIQAIETKFEELPEKVKNTPLTDLQNQIKKIVSDCVVIEMPRIRGYDSRDLQIKDIEAEILLVANDVDDPIKILDVNSHGAMFVQKFGCYEIGDADLFAHMALLNYRSNLIWPEPTSKSLSTEQGCLVAYRAVRDAIEANRGYIGPPIDIWTIKNGALPEQLSDIKKAELGEKYVQWKEAEITKLQELL